MTRILKSKPVTDAIAADLAHRVERLKILGIEPTLAIVRVGSRPDDLSYERTACKRAKALGLTTRVFELDEKVSQEKTAPANSPHQRRFKHPWLLGVPPSSL